MRIDLAGILVIPIIALVFLLLGWSYGRSITRGQPLTATMRKILLYGFIFVLGTGYSAVLDAMFGSRTPWVVFPAVWAVLLSVDAWLRSRKKDTASGAPREPISKQLADGLPVVGTIVCLIGAAIDWDLIYEGQGRWPFALLWIAGVAAMVLLARHNRRTTVVVSLRAFAVLLAIGAIARQSLPAFLAAIVVACLLFSLEKLWPNRNGRVVHTNLS
jgi:uncharacterized membrane protein YoaK (UPF0700 family)